MKIPIQDLQGSVRRKGGLQDHPKPDFEPIFKMWQGAVLKDYHDDESEGDDVDNDDVDNDDDYSMIIYLKGVEVSRHRLASIGSVAKLIDIHIYKKTKRQWY